MDDEGPLLLKRAAVFQLASGLANVFVLPAVLSMAGGLCGAFTFGFGSVCALGGCILMPIGVLEIVAGAVGLAQPARGAELMRWATWAEFASVLGGGIHSAIIGYVVTAMLDDAEVQLFLDHPSDL